VLVSSLLIVFLLTACPAERPSHLKVAIISLDGLADWVLDKLLDEGKMPNIALLVKNGIIAEHAYTSFPAITAVGHALLWTGTDPSHNAINGNQLILPPYEERMVVEGHTGFHAKPLRAEPIWAAVARQGKKALVVQATQAAPFDVYFGPEARFPVPAENLILFDNYIDGEIPDEVITGAVGLTPADDWPNLPEHLGKTLGFSREVGETALFFLLYDEPADPIKGLDTLAVCSSADGSDVLDTLKPRQAATNTENFSDPVEVSFDGKTGAAFFRLFSLEPDGSEMLLYRTRVKHTSCSNPEARKIFMEAVPGYTGNASSELYKDGAFGKPFYEGGDGTAEACYLETVRHCTELSKRALKEGMTAFDWDLLVDYLAFPDEQQHAWLGYAAPPAGDPESEMGRKAWSYLLDTYSIIDDFIGAALESLPKDAVLIIVSDHGFTSADKYFYPNTVLRDAGLLKLNDDGEVDLKKTAAVYFPGNASFILINTPRFKDGWVRPEDASEIVRRASDALLSAQDAEGRKPVAGLFYPNKDAELGMDGPYAGDIYIRLEEGYYPSGWLDAKDLVRQVEPMGVHQGDPRGRPMNSIFIAGAVRPMKKHASLGVVRGIDVAPTIAALLGLKPPAQATGKPMQKVLEVLTPVGETAK
jgi:predicted AlkP superfamily phosphohydrolase/phosphomutase